MSNIKQPTESTTPPQVKPNLDMPSHIAGMPETQTRNDKDAPMLPVPLTPVEWGQ